MTHIFHQISWKKISIHVVLPLVVSVTTNTVNDYVGNELSCHAEHQQVSRRDTQRWFWGIHLPFSQNVSTGSANQRWDKEINSESTKMLIRILINPVGVTLSCNSKDHHMKHGSQNKGITNRLQEWTVAMIILIQAAGLSTKSPLHKNTNIVNFVLAVPLERNLTNEVYNL